MIESVKSLYERMQHMADQKIDQAQTQFNTTSEEQKTELIESNSTVKQLKSNYDILKQQLKTSEDEKNNYKDQLDNLHIDNTRIVVERDELMNRTNELKLIIEELKQESRDVRDHFEHYQRRTAEDKQQEREQFRSTNQQLQEQINALREQLMASEQRLSDKNGETSHLLETIDDIKSDNQSIQLESNNKSSKMELLENKIESTIEKNQRLEKMRQSQQDEIHLLSKTNTQIEKNISLLQQSHDKKSAELEESKNRMFLLDNENKEILQAKSVIQGQFIQLQKSI